MQFHGVQYLYNMKTSEKKTLDPLSRFDQKYAFDPLTISDNDRHKYIQIVEYFIQFCDELYYEMFEVYF